MRNLFIEEYMHIGRYNLADSMLSDATQRSKDVVVSAIHRCIILGSIVKPRLVCGERRRELHPG